MRSFVRNCIEFFDKVDSFNNTDTGAELLDTIYLMPLNHLKNKQTNKTFWHAQSRIMPYIYIYIYDVVTFTN